LASVLASILRGGQLRLLLGERGQRRAPEVEDLLTRAVRGRQQPLDRLEVEALRLHVLDQPQARDVLAAVVAGPRPHLRRGQQPTRLVRPDVAHRHPCDTRELVDRELVLLLLLVRLRCHLAEKSSHGRGLADAR
jgi:hypothetical protein